MLLLCSGIGAICVRQMYVDPHKSANDKQKIANYLLFCTSRAAKEFMRRMKGDVEKSPESSHPENNSKEGSQFP